MPFSRACGSVERETCLVDAFSNALCMLGVTASLSKLRDLAIVGEEVCATKHTCEQAIKMLNYPVQ
eukprot:4554171-Pleurochrysis_carterae.AAC.1